MSYLINRFSGAELVVLEDGTVNISTDLSLVGRNTVGYGELQNENFVFLLENFSNPNPPSRPLSGQLWHASNDNSLNVYDGESWLKVGSAVFSATPPEAQTGGFWIRTTDNTLHFYNGIEWFFVGPETASGFDKTRLESSTLSDDGGVDHPVILLTVNGTVYGIIVETGFRIGDTNSIAGFSVLDKGFNLADEFTVVGNLTGTASRAGILDTTRTINGIGFNGSRDITVTANTTNQHIRGDFLTGQNFNGSSEVTWNVDASSANLVGKVVARDVSGNFSAGTINADLIGNVVGNVNIDTGSSSFNTVVANEFIGASLTGNAFSATKLQTPRSINGTQFDGTADVTVTANARTLTGTEINPNVVSSSLQSVGILNNLRVADNGVDIGTGNLNLSTSSSPTISAVGTLQISLNNDSYLNFIPDSLSLSLGGDNTDTIYGAGVNLGHSQNKFAKVYANNFIGDLTGNATSSTTSVTATNLAGGGVNGIPYQSASGITTFLAPTEPGQVLKLNGNLQPVWQDPIPFATLSVGTYINGLNYDGFTNTTWSVDATSENTASKVVARDSSGNFSAGTITADLTGIADKSDNVYITETGGGGGGRFGNNDPNTDFNIPFLVEESGGDGYRQLQVDDGGLMFNPSNNTISGVNIKFDGQALENVLTAGDEMTGFLTLHADPTDDLHAATKQYVDTATLGAIPNWAGTTTLSNVQATYANFPAGTRVAFWQERTYSRSANSNGGNVSITDRFRRVVQKQPNNSWVNVG